MESVSHGDPSFGLETGMSEIVMNRLYCHSVQLVEVGVGGAAAERLNANAASAGEQIEKLASRMSSPMILNSASFTRSMTGRVLDPGTVLASCPALCRRSLAGTRLC